uniref:Ycf66 n=1 Tax=Takakia lepidozioides TaxID=37425 RepID=A0A0S3QP11_TAKLE|nr:hypothetical protein Ycf66 [Takakia lepidozioides]UPM51617.1 hypothetical chloroplast RF66 [Takakia lepidozioides]
MIHIELGPGTVVGVGLVIVGIPSYALRIREPNVSRDYDFFSSPIGLLCGGIPIFQGWRLDPILLLSQILLSGTAISFIAESLYLRNNQIDLIFCNRNNKNNGNSLKKKHIDKTICYRKFKLKKKLLSCYYKGWEDIYYTIYISYRN